MTKYYDFDSFRKENKKEKMGIVIFGKEYEMPPITASLVMGKLMKMASSGDDKEMASMFDEETMMEVVGKENYLEWIEKGIEFDLLIAIVMQVAKSMGDNLSGGVNIDSVKIVDGKKK